MTTTIEKLKKDYKNLKNSPLKPLLDNHKVFSNILKHYPTCFENEKIYVNHNSLQSFYEINIPIFPTFFKIQLHGDNGDFYKISVEFKDVSLNFHYTQMGVNFFQLMSARIVEKYYGDLPKAKEVVQLLNNDFELGLMLFKTQLYDYYNIDKIKKDFNHHDEYSYHEIITALSGIHNLEENVIANILNYF